MMSLVSIPETYLLSEVINFLKKIKPAKLSEWPSLWESFKEKNLIRFYLWDLLKISIVKKQNHIYFESISQIL